MAEIPSRAKAIKVVGSKRGHSLYKQLSKDAAKKSMCLRSVGKM